MSCWGTRSPTASPSARNRGARCSLCRLCRPVTRTIIAATPSARWRVFSLHAGVAAKAHERKKRERLCRYISRPAVSEKRLSLMPKGNIRYELKTPYRDGTTHVIFEPLDFISRLAALVPRPKVNLTRFHGVFAPNSRHRAWVTPARRGRGTALGAEEEGVSVFRGPKLATGIQAAFDRHSSAT